MIEIFLTETFVTYSPYICFLLLGISPTLTFPFSTPLFLRISFFPSAQCSSERLPQHQGGCRESKCWLQLDHWWSRGQRRLLFHPFKPAALPFPPSTTRASSPPVHTHKLRLLPDPYSCEYHRFPLFPSLLCALVAVTLREALINTADSLSFCSFHLLPSFPHSFLSSPHHIYHFLLLHLPFSLSLSSLQLNLFFFHPSPASTVH